MGPEMNRDRFPQVVLPVGGHEAVILLPFVACIRQYALYMAWNETAADQRLHCRPANEQLPTSVQCSVINSFRGNFRLEDGRIGWWFAWQARLDPVKLGCVAGGQMDHRHPDIALIVEQLCTHGLRKSLNGVLGSTICRLQRNAAESQGRANLNDRAMIARGHSL